jgi:phage host-nuclease inhibitor protein Gam
MDEGKLILLQTDIGAQLQLIESIEKKLLERALGITPEDSIRLESIAYQIHNLYCAIEDLLKLVAAYCENNITDTQQ